MNTKYFKYAIILGILIRVFLAVFVHEIHTDFRNDMDWGIRFWEYGSKFYYKANVWSFDWPNQPPGTIYFHALVRKLHEAVFGVFWFLNIHVPIFPSKLMFFLEKNLFAIMIKLSVSVFDAGLALVIYKLVKKKFDIKKARLAAALLWLNPVIWYNSAVWGQYDSVNNFFAILAAYLLLEKKPTFALASLIVSLYVKVSLLIYLPVITLVLLKQNYGLKKYFRSFLMIAIFLYILFLPFSDKNPYLYMVELYKNRVLGNQLQLITANAFNLWAAIAGIHQLPHDLLFGPLTFKIWGQLLFSLSYIPVIILLLRNKIGLKSIFWSLSIVSISSFMLLTNMHERYLYPFFTTFIIVIFFEKRLIIHFWTLSVINLLNLYNFWWVPKIVPVIGLLSFENRIMLRLLGLISFLLYINLYIKYLTTSKLSFKIVKVRPKSYE